MNYKTQLSKIELFAFDYDGVFTNGTVWLMPDGSMARSASARDGFAVQWAVKQGLQLAVVSGGKEEPVKWRMEGLGVKEVHLGAADKLAHLTAIAGRMGIGFGPSGVHGRRLARLDGVEGCGLELLSARCRA